MSLPLSLKEAELLLTAMNFYAATRSGNPSGGEMKQLGSKVLEYKEGLLIELEANNGCN